MSWLLSSRPYPPDAVTIAEPPSGSRPSSSRRNCETWLRNVVAAAAGGRAPDTAGGGLGELAPTP